ncbi:MAG: RNase adapter RapZ [Firmicutes bacterium]|nr:RNase adapter RapZ [Bacillota bacterium]MDH7494438.1 RNase adapter RapZ [Bacillota bacterium]
MGEERFVIITGLSGAGKSEAVRAFEDMGFFCVDNLPPTLIPKFAELVAQSEGKTNRIALVVDIRSREFFDSLCSALDDLEGMGVTYEILFLEASDEVLVRRFKETRRRHPLSSEGGGVLEGIEDERRRLGEIRGRATRILDTTSLSPRQLRERIMNVFTGESRRERLDVIVVAFGFKHGIPMDADLVFDVRFLPNPHYVESLRKLTGDTEPVREYVFQSPVTRRFLQKLFDLMAFLLPHYVKEGKTQLVVGIGCTGGKHRSIAVADRLAGFLKERGYNVSVEYRDRDVQDKVAERERDRDPHDGGTRDVMET